MKIYLLCQHISTKILPTYKAFYLRLLKYKNKNKIIIIIENMFSMQAKKSSSGQMFGTLEKMSNTGENTCEIDYLIKWNLLQKRQHRFCLGNFLTVYNFKNPEKQSNIINEC